MMKCCSILPAIKTYIQTHPRKIVGLALLTQAAALYSCVQKHPHPNVCWELNGWGVSSVYAIPSGALIVALAIGQCHNTTEVEAVNHDPTPSVIGILVDQENPQFGAHNSAPVEVVGIPIAPIVAQSINRGVRYDDDATRNSSTLNAI